MPQTKRVTDRHGKIAHAQFIRVGDGDLRQLAGVLNLQQGDVALIVAANQFGLEFTPVIQLNADLLRLINHMIVGQNIAFCGIDNDPGTQSFKRLRLLIGQIIAKEFFKLFRDFLRLSRGAFNLHANDGR